MSNPDALDSYAQVTLQNSAKLIRAVKTTTMFDDWSEHQISGFLLGLELAALKVEEFALALEMRTLTDE